MENTKKGYENYFINATLEDYISRKKISLSCVVITDERIQVVSEEYSTSYINLIKPKYIELTDLQKQFKRIKKDFKEKGIKFTNVKNGINSQLKILIEMQNDYDLAYNKMHNKWIELQWAWKMKIKQGFYMGTSDDLFYNNYLVPLKFEIEKMMYRSTILSQVAEIVRKIKSLENDLKHSENLISISA